MSCFRKNVNIYQESILFTYVLYFSCLSQDLRKNSGFFLNLFSFSKIVKFSPIHFLLPKKITSPQQSTQEIIIELSECEQNFVLKYELELLFVSFPIFLFLSKEELLIGSIFKVTKYYLLNLIRKMANIVFNLILKSCSITHSFYVYIYYQLQFSSYQPSGASKVRQLSCMFYWNYSSSSLLFNGDRLLILSAKNWWWLL